MVFFSARIIIFGFTLKLRGRKERSRCVSSCMWICMHMYVYVSTYVTQLYRDLEQVMRGRWGRGGDRIWEMPLSVRKGVNEDSAGD